MIRLAWRLLRRELRAGEIRLLFAALVVAVAAVTAVGFLADRVRQALVLEAHQLLGADLVLVADHPWPAKVAERAAGAGLSLARSEIFPSMVLAGDRAQLADIKAVGGAYPLRGQVRIAPGSGRADRVVNGGPAPGEAWVEERLAAQLGIAVGDTVGVGRLPLRIAGILTQEPDRGINFFTLAPRLMMRVEDLPATGLIQAGSRIGYRLLVAGEAAAVKDFRQWLETCLERGERIEDAGNARPEMRSALERAQRFLGLATLLTVVLAALAVALAARRYMQRHLDACAIMRCLGATQNELAWLHGVFFLLLAGLAAAVGCGVGYGAHEILQRLLAGIVDGALPPPSPLPAVQGMLVAAVLLIGFALPPVLRLRGVPTLRVLRREMAPAPGTLFGAYGVGALLCGGLVFWMAGDPKLGAYVLGGFAGAGLLFLAFGHGVLLLLGSLRGAGRSGWRQGLANLRRHRWADTLQVVALAVGIMAMLLLTVTRNQLLAAWQQSVPPDAPNRFVINIQPDQVGPVGDMLAAEGIRTEVLPMVRGRLTAIDEREVSAAAYPEDERAQRLVEREFNLSWRADLPPGNRMVAGRWFRPGEAGQPVASVEEGLANTLGIRLGDRLTFTIAGEKRSFTVVGLRKLDWDSMRVNFFVLTPPGVIDSSPASHITSFHLDPGNAGLAHALVARFPNLTVIDVGAILAQLRDLMGRVAQAIQFVFVFTIAAGAVVLYAALLAAADERRYELAVLRAIGASRRQLRTALIVELAAVGAVAGLIAAGGALVVGAVVARQVFQLELPITLVLLPASALVSALLAVALGWLAVSRMLNRPAANLLREAV